MPGANASILTEAGSSGPRRHNVKRRWGRKCAGKNSEILNEETERQHMHWQRYKLELEEEDVCLCATVCLFPKPNRETEWRDYSLLATVLANMAVWKYLFLKNLSSHNFPITSLCCHSIIFNRSGCNKFISQIQITVSNTCSHSPNSQDDYSQSGSECTLLPVFALRRSSELILIRSMYRKNN